MAIFYADREQTLPPGSARRVNFAIDQADFAIGGANGPTLRDANSGVQGAWSNSAGNAAAHGYGVTNGRLIALSQGGLGSYYSTLTIPFAIAAGEAPNNPLVSVVEVGLFSELVALPAGVNDMGFFFKTSTGAFASIFGNSVRYGIIPADERAFGINRETSGLWAFVAINGATGVRTVTALPSWPAPDARTPVKCSFIFEAPTADSPAMRFSLRLNGVRINGFDRVAMVAGNPLGLPFSWGAAGRTMWAPVFISAAPDPQIGFVEYQYFTGDDLEGTL